MRLTRKRSLLWTKNRLRTRLTRKKSTSRKMSFRLMPSTMSRRMMRHISTKIILSFKSRRLKYSKSPKSRCRSQSPKENRPHARHVPKKMLLMERMRTSPSIDVNSGVTKLRRCFFALGSGVFRGGSVKKAAAVICKDRSGIQVRRL